MQKPERQIHQQEYRRIPHVAVLMSTWNGETYLSAQIDSICSQKDVDITIFIRDDGSSDATLQIISNHTCSRHIKLLNGSAHLGPARSYLEIIRSIPDDYDYYAFSDQDDIWLPEKLSSACTRLECHQKAALYCSALTLVDESLKIIGKHELHVNTSKIREVFFQNYATGNTVVLNADAVILLKKHSSPSYVYMHDWWILTLLLISGATIVYDTHSYILYRQHTHNAIGMKGVRLTLLEWILEIKSGSHTKAALKQLASVLDEDITWKDTVFVESALTLVHKSDSWISRIHNISAGYFKTRTISRYILYSLSYVVHVYKLV